ncbi:hypothetical protein SKAU_G00139070 [Synaphobranchus kaupii]|uniref:PH domain-containing protein n=1 Tax=Synaphobranchus kaupii TaxID=118154 RepID=A0A9Q1J3T5_SYNKA|nr:hypothetical protein SKAU_G00139070 [Synaphobranchus kaupii]
MKAGGLYLEHPVFDEIPMVAAQELCNILKQGYLEKKRRDHSFFSSEWQKRWCVLNNTIFYYFGSEKDKQQKGSFYINGYSAVMATQLRKDSKKNASFELNAPGRRPFQFTASSQQEAREWVDQINFVLKDMSSNFIPFDDDDEEAEEEAEEEEETYDDIDAMVGPPPPRPAPALGVTPHSSQEERRGNPRVQDQDEEDDDIYEVLPEDEFADSNEEVSEKNSKPAWSMDYASYYQGLWDCDADEPDELGFQRGDLIHVISKASCRAPSDESCFPCQLLRRVTGVMQPLTGRPCTDPVLGVPLALWADAGQDSNLCARNQKTPALKVNPAAFLHSPRPPCRKPWHWGDLRRGDAPLPRKTLFHQGSLNTASFLWPLRPPQSRRPRGRAEESVETRPPGAIKQAVKTAHKRAQLPVRPPRQGPPPPSPHLPRGLPLARRPPALMKYAT